MPYNGESAAAPSSLSCVKVAQWCPTLCNPMNCSLWNSPGQNTGVGSLSLLEGIFPTQGLNSGLPHCRQTLYRLNHQGIRHVYTYISSLLSLPPTPLPHIFFTGMLFFIFLTCRNSLCIKYYAFAGFGFFFTL